MTGQELIKKLKKKICRTGHLFIDVEGYISPVCEVLETRSGDIILTGKAEVLMICTIKTIWKDIFQNGSRSFKGRSRT